MIIAHAKPCANSMRLEIIYPDSNVREFATAANEMDATRLIYFLNRRYIIAKLRAWLKQRGFALETVPRKNRSLEVAKLLVLLNFYENAGLHVLCEFIHTHKGVIESIAPCATSRQFNYYHNTIEPILGFCQAMIG
jgi:hypothetical protein